MKNSSLKPFLKWAGGKRWLFESDQISVPCFGGKYIEPFLGGGAVFFHLRPRNAQLSDTNSRLIELYTVIRDDLAEFERLMKQHARAHSKDYYYAIRERSFQKPVKRAAQLLYLNRTCWNGLYRENLNGQFNVPIGTKQTVLLHTDDFVSWSNALQGISLRCVDFEVAINGAVRGDFVFVDPPYTVRHNMNGFVKYNQKIFSWEDQIRLRNALARASKRGVRFAMTNADHKSVRELYAEIGEQRDLVRYSVIGGQSAYRGRSTELLVCG